MKKVMNTLMLILIAFVLASCSTSTGQMPVTSTPVEEPSQTSMPTASIRPSPLATPQQTTKADIPAYLAVGLQKRSEMSPEWESYYYLPYYDMTGDACVFDSFQVSTSTDLDGDGKEEAITLIGGKPYDGIADVDPSFADITIDIDGSRLHLTSDKNLPFTLDGRILDIDKNDSKKEILLKASLILTGKTQYIISYDDKEPRTIFTGELNYPLYTVGTGYIITPASYHTTWERLYYYEFWMLKDDRSGFEAAGNIYYPTHHQTCCWDDSGNWDEAQAAPTQWDEYLYSEPGGGQKTLIEKGTSVFLGMYAKKSWLMILDTKGNLLGWLDADNVDFEGYTNHAFEPEGD